MSRGVGEALDHAGMGVERWSMPGKSGGILRKAPNESLGYTQVRKGNCGVTFTKMFVWRSTVQHVWRNVHGI